MWQLYVYSFLAGLIGANGVPHYIKGIIGNKYRTPFGNPSSAVVNVAWGWLNLVVAGLLIHYAHPRAHELRAGGTLALGVLLMSLVMAATGPSMANPKSQSKS